MFWLCYGEYKGIRELRPFKRYIEARAEQQNRDDMYRFYVTETLRLFFQNKCISKSYFDFVYPQKQEAKEVKTGKEVANEAAKKMGIKINWG